MEDGHNGDVLVVPVLLDLLGTGHEDQVVLDNYDELVVRRDIRNDQEQLIPVPFQPIFGLNDGTCTFLVHDDILLSSNLYKWELNQEDRQ